jgi:outer membrane receptor protein involved in Fe transport
VAFVRGLDSALIRNQGLGFDDQATNWSVYGKVRISNLTVGLQMWQSQEGIASEYRALTTAGGTTWTPRQSALYVKYSVPLERVKVNFFTRYEQSNIERGGSEFEYLHTYATGFLGIKSLVPPCKADADQTPIGCPAAPWVETVAFSSLSNQLRSELNLSYDSSEKLKAVAGLELVKSSIQSQLAQTDSGPGQLFFGVSQKPEQIEHTDLAVYAQGSWKPRPSLKFILAGRLTNNQINNKVGASGFGTLFTPRAGVIYMPPGNRVTLKAIYSEAFKDPTDAQKFGVVPRVNEFVSKGLKPETVQNIELSAAWEPIDRASFEASLYQARYSDVVSFGGVTGCNGTGCNRYENRDAIRIRGMQSTAHYRGTLVDLWANYTHTEPFLIDPRDAFGGPLLDAQKHPLDRLRVADIASDQWNAGLDSQWPEWLKIGVRLHYVGARKTGAGTTEPDNPFAQMDAHTTADAIISESRLVPHATLQLIVYNLFDKQYYDPGINPAVGAARVPQAGRTIYLRLVYGLGRAERQATP